MQVDKWIMIKNNEKRMKSCQTIKPYFDNIKYGSHPQYNDFDNLTIEYKQRSFTEQPIYC